MTGAMVQRIVDAMLRPVRRRVALMVRRALVDLSDDSGGLQMLQIAALPGEVLGQVPRMQQYGFSARPLKGAQVLFACVGGHTADAVAFAVDDPRHRPTGLAEGEVVMYSDEGDRITLKRGRIIEVVAGAELRVIAPAVNVTADDVTVTATTGINLATPETFCTGNLTVAGNATVGGNIAATGAGSTVSDPTGTLGAVRDAYNVHVHIPGPGPTPTV